MTPAQTSHAPSSLRRSPSPGQATRHRPGFWFSMILALLGLLLLTALFNLALPPLTLQLEGPQHIIVVLLISLFPALLWMVLFAALDRASTAPTHAVGRVFLLAALLAAAVAIPLWRTVFQIDLWLDAAWWSQMGGSVLVLGFVQVGVLYAALRFGVYFDQEFNEPIDGVIYGVAAGLGLASVLSLAAIWGKGSVHSIHHSLSVVTGALAYAGLGGLMGYYLGRVRSDATSFFYLPGGVMISGVLAGLFVFARDWLSASFSTADMTSALLLALALSTALLGLILLLIHRTEQARRLTVQVQPAPPQRSRAGRRKATPRQATAVATPALTVAAQSQARRQTSTSPAASSGRVSRLRSREPARPQSLSKQEAVTASAVAAPPSESIIRDLEESWRALMGDRAAAQKRDASQNREEALI